MSGHAETCHWHLSDDAGLRRNGWAHPGPVCKVFAEAFASAGLQTFNLHSFRATLVQVGERVCPNIEAFKAWSLNRSHAHAMTELTSYSTMSSHRQTSLILFPKYLDELE